MRMIVARQVPIDGEEMINSFDQERIQNNMVWTIFSTMATIDLIVNFNLLKIQYLQQTRLTALVALVF